MGRSWRVFATGLLFCTFGIGGLLASVSVFPVIVLTCRDRVTRIRRSRAFIGVSFRGFLWIMCLLRVARFEIDREACERIGDENGTIVVANHPTLIDVIFLLGYIRQANCVVKSAVWKNPCMSWAVRAAGYIPNGEFDLLLEACAAALQAGEPLIIFPEATRTVPGRPLQLHRGAANIAVRLGATIRLVHFDCDPTVLSKAEPWYHVPSCLPCFKMKVGGSLRARDFTGGGVPFGIAARQLTDILEEELSVGVPRDEGVRERA